MITEIQPGSYREPLAAGLREQGQDKLADAVKHGRLKLGITERLREVDTAKPEFTQTFIEALATPAAAAVASVEVREYYSMLLRRGGSVPAVDGGPSAGHSHYQRDWQSGELFLKS